MDAVSYAGMLLDRRGHRLDYSRCVDDTGAREKDLAGYVLGIRNLGRRGLGTATGVECLEWYTMVF